MQNEALLTIYGSFKYLHFALCWCLKETKKTLLFIIGTEGAQEMYTLTYDALPKCFFTFIDELECSSCQMNTEDHNFMHMAQTLYPDHFYVMVQE